MDQRPVAERFLSATILLAIAACATSASAGTWSGGGTVGYALGTPSFRSHDFERANEVSMPGTSLCKVHVERDFNRHISLLGQAMYIPYRSSQEGKVQHVPLSLGARYSLFAKDQRRGGPYIEVSPSIVWSHWRVPGFGWHEESGINPGLIAGFGVHGRPLGGLGMDVGVRYLLSDNGKTLRFDPNYWTELRGLRDTALILGLSLER